MDIAAELDGVRSSFKRCFSFFSRELLPLKLYVHVYYSEDSTSKKFAHTCTLDDGGRVTCCGIEGVRSPENLTDVVAISAGDGHTCTLHENGQISYWVDDMARGCMGRA